MKKVILLILTSILLFSCNKEADNNTIRIAISQDVANLDVMRSTSRVLRDILVGHVYEKLFVLSNGEVIPELATGYEISEEGRKLKIFIRNDVMMHDGSLMNENDVSSSLNRYIDCYEAASNMTGDARFFPDDGSVVIESDNPLYLFVYLLASSPQSAVIAKESSLEENDYGLITNIVGSGPYTLDSFSPGSMIKLKKFDAYTKKGVEGKEGLASSKEAYFENIEFYVVQEAATRTLGLLRGDYDFINDVMSHDMPRLRKEESVSLVGGEESGAIALVFNKKSPLSSSLDFRRAVAYALDYEDLMRACYGDYGFNVHSDYMEKEQTLFSVEGDPYLEQDVEKAKEALRNANYNGEPFRILTSNLSNLDKIAVAAESMLEDVGINVEIIVQDWVGFLDRRNNSADYDMFVSAFSSVTLPQMKLFLGSEYPGWYVSDTKDDIMASLSNAKTIEEASDIWKDAQHFFWSDLPVIVTGHYSTINAYRSNIEGIIVEDGNHFYNAKRSGD